MFKKTLIQINKKHKYCTKITRDNSSLGKRPFVRVQYNSMVHKCVKLNETTKN